MHQQIEVISPMIMIVCGTSPVHIPLKLLNTWIANSNIHTIRVSCSHDMSRAQAQQYLLEVKRASAAAQSRSLILQW